MIMRFLFAAYAVIWFITFLLILSIELRQAEAEKELEALKKTIGKKE
jgi:CcmD family protein